MKHLFLIIFSISLVVAPSLAAPFDGETPEPYGGNPFGGYQMRSVAPMYQEKPFNNEKKNTFSINLYSGSTELDASTTQSGYSDDYGDEYDEEDGPGVPKVTPLTMGWDVILLLITLAFIYAISIAQKRKKTTI
jgi:hypothetical protein